MAVEVRLAEKECLRGGMDEAARVVRVVQEGRVSGEGVEEEGRVGKRRRVV